MQTRITWTTLALLSLVPLALAQEKSGDKPKIQTEMTKVDADGKVGAYLARPAGDAAAPAILLIHEYWGLNDWVKKQADRFAEQGYVALAVDLYRGEVAKDADHAHELMRGLTDERAMADMKAAFDYLAKQKFTKDKPIGVIGWCMGGGHALRLAVSEPRLAATVVCYGRPVTDEAQLKQINGPILGVFGETDRGIDVDSFKKALEKASKKADIQVYPGAGHAFLNDSNAKAYNKDQAEKAWREIDQFFRKSLKVSTP